MPASEAEVCNLALLLVGQTQLIDDLSDETEEGELCALIYSKARDAALEAFAWPFATRRASLTAVSGLTDAEMGAWDFAYTLPADLLAPRWIWDGTENPGQAEKIPYSIEDRSTGGRLLFSNMESAVLVYTRKVTETGKFSPLFVEALSAKIAVYLAAGLVKKPTLALEMERLFQSRIAQAAAAQFNQQQKDEDPDSAFVDERG